MNSYIKVGCINLYTINALSSVDQHAISSVSNNILCLSKQLNTWSSKFIVTHNGQSIDISSVAMGKSSTGPCGVPLQDIRFPCTVYQFDEKKYHTISQEDDLVTMIMSPSWIDGCKLVSQKKGTIFQKCSWTFVCKHGKLAEALNESAFKSDCVGKSKVVYQKIGRSCTELPKIKCPMNLILSNVNKIFCFE
jgi:hypothetical protein